MIEMTPDTVLAYLALSEHGYFRLLPEDQAVREVAGFLASFYVREDKSANIWRFAMDWKAAG
jgi:hypothetical protein